MKTLIRLAVVTACLGIALVAAPQYTPNQLPSNYGANKLGQCYNTTLNNWVNILPTTANYAAFPVQCDQQGNLLAASGFVAAPSPTVSTDLATFNGTKGQIQDSGILAVSVATVGTPTVGHASCIKAAGPPVVIGYCSTVVASDGTCTCQ